MRKNKPVSTRRSSFSLAAMLVGICLSFLGIIFISVIYIAKDYYAYNSVYAFFGIDSQTLLWLMGLPVGQMTLLRLLNFSHACFIVCSVMFAMSFSSLLPERVARFLGWLIGAIWLVQVVFLDPQFTWNGSESLTTCASSGAFTAGLCGCCGGFPSDGFCSPPGFWSARFSARPLPCGRARRWWRCFLPANNSRG